MAENSGYRRFFGPVGAPLQGHFDSIGHRGVLEIEIRSCEETEALPPALYQIVRLLCLYEFDALSLLRHAGQYSVYLQSQKHHESRHVQPEHEDYHRSKLTVDLPVVT